MELRILVVEDDEQLQRTWIRLLKRRGHEVSVVATVAECRSAMSASAPDVLLLDRQLGGEDGWQLRDDAPKTTRVVLMTGNPPENAPPHYFKAHDPVETLYRMIEG